MYKTCRLDLSKGTGGSLVVASSLRGVEGSSYLYSFFRETLIMTMGLVVPRGEPMRRCNYIPIKLLYSRIKVLSQDLFLLACELSLGSD